MVRVDGLGRYECITTFIRHDSDGMPPRLNICSVDILDDARYGEVVDAARRLQWLGAQKVRTFVSNINFAAFTRRSPQSCAFQPGEHTWSSSIH